jgi:hypothetical protein
MVINVKNGHQYVVAIGIDHYQNWPVLSTAVSDATGFAAGDQTLSTGYIVPWDARPPGVDEHYSDYLKVEDLLRG